MSGQSMCSKLSLPGSGGAAASNSIIVKDEGGLVPNTPHIQFDFVGAGVTATDGGAGVATITIPGAGTSGLTNVDYHAVTGPEAAAKQFTLVGAPATPALALSDIVGGSTIQPGIDFTIAAAIFDWNGLGLDGFLNAGDIVRIAYAV